MGRIIDYQKQNFFVKSGLDFFVYLAKPATASTDETTNVVAKNTIPSYTQNTAPTKNKYIASFINHPITKYASSFLLIALATFAIISFGNHVLSNSDLLLTPQLTFLTSATLLSYFIANKTRINKEGFNKTDAWVFGLVTLLSVIAIFVSYAPSLANTTMPSKIFAIKFASYVLSLGLSGFFLYHASYYYEKKEKEAKLKHLLPPTDLNQIYQNSLKN